MTWNQTQYSWPPAAPAVLRPNETTAVYDPGLPKWGQHNNDQTPLTNPVSGTEHGTLETQLVYLLQRTTTAAERAGELADYYRSQLLGRDSVGCFWDTYMWNEKTIELVWHGVVATEQIEILSQTIFSSNHPGSTQSALVCEQEKNRCLQQDLVTAERRLRYCQIELLRRDLHNA